MSLIENAVTEFFLFQIFLSTFLFPIVFLFSTYIILAKKLPALPQIYISASHSDTSPDALHCKTYCMIWHMFYKADTMSDKSPASISNHFSISIAICIIFSKDSLKCSSSSAVRFLEPLKCFFPDALRAFLFRCRSISIWSIFSLVYHFPD